VVFEPSGIISNALTPVLLSRPWALIVDFRWVNRPTQAGLDADAQEYNFTSALAPVRVNGKAFTPECVADLQLCLRAIGWREPAIGRAIGQ
jgi:hypothetical protein